MAVEFLGKLPFHVKLERDRHTLLVAVPFSTVGALEQVALLDTAAEWCVPTPELAVLMGFDLDPDPNEPPLPTRFGRLEGHLERAPLWFLADNGPVEIDATWFVSPYWPGQNVIGWTGALQRVRFALDPEAEMFHVGAPAQE